MREMAVSRDEFAARLGVITRSEDVPGLRDAVIAALGELGFRAAYFVTPPKADNRVGRIISTLGLPKVWDRRYRSHLHPFDPLPELALGEVGAFAWPSSIDPSVLDRRNIRFLEIAARYGLERGIGTMCYGPHGRCGFLALVSPAGMAEPDDLTLLEVHTLGQLAFRRYCQLVRSGEEMPRLSGRELDVLHLISRGKSNGVIADVLGIAPTSVDAYVRRIFAKMGVSDRTTASVKGQALGLIAPWDHDRLMREAEERLPTR